MDKHNTASPMRGLVATALLAVSLLAACTASTTIEPTAATTLDVPTAVPPAADTQPTADTAPAPTVAPVEAAPAPTPAPLATLAPEAATQDDTALGNLAAGEVSVVLLDPGAEPRTQLRLDIAASCTELTSVEQTQAIQQTLGGRPSPAAPPVTTIVETATSVQGNSDDYNVRSEVLSASVAPETDPSIAGLMNAELQTMVGLTTWVTLTDRAIQVPGSTRIEGAEGNPMLEGILESLSAIQAPLPVEPVGVGATWQTVSVIDFEGAELTITTDYLIASIDGTLITLATSASQSVPVGSQLVLEGFDVEIAAWSGTSTGQTVIDLATITPLSATISGQAIQELDFGPAAGGLLEQSIETSVALRAVPNEGCLGRATRP